jgi:hypothetical protein
MEIWEMGCDRFGVVSVGDGRGELEVFSVVDVVGGSSVC